MGRTPSPGAGENVETMTYPVPPKRSQHDEETMTSVGGARQRASYTPSSQVDEHAYGTDAGKANAQTGNVPEVVVSGSSEAAAPPAMPGTFRVGVDKNVSTPVSG